MSTLVNHTQTQKKNFRMVFFISKEESDKAMQLEELYAVPWSIGPFSLIVPAKTVSLLRKKDLKIKAVLKPINRTDLTPEQYEDMKNRKALVWTSHTINFFIDKELANWLGDLIEKTYPRGRWYSNAKTKKKEASKD